MSRGPRSVQGRTDGQQNWSYKKKYFEMYTNAIYHFTPLRYTIVHEYSVKFCVLLNTMESCVERSHSSDNLNNYLVVIRSSFIFYCNGTNKK